MSTKPLGLIVLALMALFSVGCCHTARLNVTVELDPAMKQRLTDLSNRNIEIDIVAVNSKENQRWENYSMTKYWTPPYELKNSVKPFVMLFDPTKDNTKTLYAKDPIWDVWLANTSDKDVVHLYVLALLPGTFDDANGDADPRRQILPLDSCRWASTDVKLSIQKTGITTLTAPKPEK